MLKLTYCSVPLVVISPEGAPVCPLSYFISEPCCLLWSLHLEIPDSNLIPLPQCSLFCHHYIYKKT